MIELLQNLQSVNWAELTFEGARCVQMLQWAKLPLDRIIASLEDGDVDVPFQASQAGGGRMKAKNRASDSSLYTLEVGLISGLVSESFAKANPVVARTIEIRGDDWWHNIAVIEIAESAPAGRYPRVTERVGESPPQYMDWDEESDDV